MAITPLPAVPLRSDAPATFVAKADAFLGSLNLFATEVDAVGVALTLGATNATSTTSLLIGLGSKSLTVQTGKSYVAGMTLKIASTASPSNWMLGDITSYVTGTGALVVNVTNIQGSGTLASWTLSQSAPGGASNGVNNDITSLTALTSINGGQLAGMRNRIINGNFGINQRAVTGTVTLAAGAYGHDRWKAGAGGCTYTFATALNVTTLTISAGTLMQVIEGLNLESGSFKLSWTGTATGKIDAGAFSASGVVGTAIGGTNQTVEFSTGTVSKVMYEIGSVATPFEQRPYGMELALCQWYLPCFVSNGSTYTPLAVGQAYSTTAAQAVISFPVQARVPSTGCVVSNQAHFGCQNAAGSPVASTGITLMMSSPTCATVNITGSSGLVAGNAANIFIVNAVGYIYFTGCEL